MVPGCQPDCIASQPSFSKEILCLVSDKAALWERGLFKTKWWRNCFCHHIQIPPTQGTLHLFRNVSGKKWTCCNFIWSNNLVECCLAQTSDCSRGSYQGGGGSGINIKESSFIHLFFNGGMRAGRVVPSEQQSEAKLLGTQSKHWRCHYCVAVTQELDIYLIIIH